MHTVGCETNKKNWLLFSFFFFGFHFQLFFPKGLVTAFGGARLFAICLFTFQDLLFLFFRHFSLFFMLLPIAAFPDPSVFSHRKSIYICEKQQKLIQNQNKLSLYHSSSKTEQLTRAKMQFIDPILPLVPLLSKTSPVETLELFRSKHLCLILCIP